MSLAVVLQNDDSITLAVDTRESIRINGQCYALSDNCEKAVKIGNKLLFGCGGKDLLYAIWQAFSILPEQEQSISNLQKISRELTKIGLKQNGVENDESIYKDLESPLLTSVIMAAMEDGEPVVYKLSAYNDHEIERFINHDNGTIIHTGGIKASEAEKFLLDPKNQKSGFNIGQLYSNFSYEGIGGFVTIWRVDRAGIRMLSKIKIKDSRPIKYYHAVCTGATIRTGAQGARMVMTPSGLTSWISDTEQGISITNDNWNMIKLVQSNGYIASVGETLMISTGMSSPITIWPNGDLNLYSGGEITLQDANYSRTLAQLVDHNHNGQYSQLGHTHSGYGVSLAFDEATRNLKMYDEDGTLIAIVNIP